MIEDLEEIKERQDQLEQYVRLLEARVDAQESIMRLYAAPRKSATLPGPSSTGQDTGRVPMGEEDLRLRGFDSLLRSILTKQGMHSTDIRESTRDQKRFCRAWRALSEGSVRSKRTCGMWTGTLRRSLRATRLAEFVGVDRCPTSSGNLECQCPPVSCS